MNSISPTFLHQPYPFYYDRKVKLVIAGLLFLMTLLFGYFFEPFNVYVPEHKMGYFWITFIHGLTPAVVVGLFSLVSTSSKTKEHWSVGKEALLIALFLLFVGVIQFLIRDLIYDNPNNWSWRYLYEEIRNTFLVGSLFAAILIPLNFNRLNAINNRGANVLNNRNSTNSSEESKIVSQKSIVVDDMELNIDDFLFAKAEGNYAEIHLTGEKTGKVLKRITFKELEALLKPYDTVVKTHRSYLVNKSHIKKVTGNAQGYKLQLAYGEEIVPVSRKMIPYFEAIVNGG